MECFLLLEDGQKLVLEDGTGFLLLETCDDQGGGGRVRENNAHLYHTTRHEWELKQKELLKNKDRFEEKERELKTLEARRNNRLDDLALQTQLLTLLKEIDRLENNISRIMAEMAFLQDEEEAFIVLMLANPFSTLN